VTYGDVTPVAVSNDRLFALKRDTPEVKPESTPETEVSSADKIRATYGVLETAQLQSGKGTTRLGCLQVTVGYRQAGRSRA
jgi:hypothetical protein